MSKSRYPGIQRLSSGRYQVRVTWVDAKTGKKKDLKKVIAAASMAEANSQRELLRAQLLTSGTTQRERVRLGEYASSWMRGKIPTLKPSTRDKYAGMLDRHILPALGDNYVDAISPQDVNLWRDAQHAKASTVNSRLRVLRALLRDAQADLGLPRDPCARVRTLAEKPPVGNRLKPGDLQRVLAYLREDERGWYPLFLTMALTGARFGEVSALQWEDIDEDARVVRKLLKSHSAVNAKNADLSGVSLYREALLHSKLVDPSQVDTVLWQAEDSIDLWTTHSGTRLGFREVVHFVVSSQYHAAGNLGTVVSFKNIVYSMVSEDL